MPAAAHSAAPVTALPHIRSRNFTHRREYWAQENTYKNGERQVALLVATSRSSFEFTGMLTATEMTALRAFYDARKGGLEPFYFYYGPETSPLFTTDPTGSDVGGRYIVVFQSNWEQSMNLGRGEAAIKLVEVN